MAALQNGNTIGPVTSRLLASCDWGTSSFRLCLVDRYTLAVLYEVHSDEGIAVVFKKWQQHPAHDRFAFYTRCLEDAMNLLEAQSGISLADTDILVSGMAGSSIGIKELPYASLPFSMDGAAVVAEWFRRPSGNGKILLISGLSADADVMRGEETQLLGISRLLKEYDGKCTYIFPGTHSKHIRVSNHKITGFKTFLTGEIFGLLYQYSILAASLSKPEDDSINEENAAAFRAGVEKASDTDLLHNLFSVRVRQLQHKYSHGESYFYLSGLLIGSELKSRVAGSGERYVICGGKKLGPFYRLALECIGMAKQTCFIDDDTVDIAAAAGQVYILNQLQQPHD